MLFRHLRPFLRGTVAIFRYAMEADLEYRNLFGGGFRNMSGWHIVQQFASPPTVHFEYHVQITASSQDELECCRILTVHTSRILHTILMSFYRMTVVDRRFGILP